MDIIIASDFVKDLPYSLPSSVVGKENMEDKDWKDLFSTMSKADFRTMMNAAEHIVSTAVAYHTSTDYTCSIKVCVNPSTAMADNLWDNYLVPLKQFIYWHRATLSTKEHKIGSITISWNSTGRGFTITFDPVIK